jgi:hypothetical protein
MSPMAWFALMLTIAVLNVVTTAIAADVQHGALTVTGVVLTALTALLATYWLIVAVAS